MNSTSKRQANNEFLPEATALKEEIKDEPRDDYAFPTNSGFIYDATEIKEEVEDYKEYPYDDNDGILDTSLQNANDILSSLLTSDHPASQPKRFCSGPSTSKPTTSVVPRCKDEIRRVVKPAIPCSECGELFKFNFQLDNHTREKHAPPVRQAPLIDQSLLRVEDVTNDQSWRGHTQLDGCFFVENPITKMMKDPRGGKTITFVECGVCEERFPNARDHRIHAIRSHRNNLEERMCKNDYCVRMRIAHNPNSAPKKGDVMMSERMKGLLSPMYDPISCPICAVRQESYYHLHTHYMAEHAIDYFLRFECKGCGHVYTSPKGLNKHIIHESRRSNRCHGTASVQTPKPRKKRITNCTFSSNGSLIW
ncbi:hypothetical protein PENTCL1PPCAC_28313 [Pristionchus entomophagus]|uniref:C2H2-type domain-containing protein n=1 Tax=Pristionchus entomophagus TaxID=358040 RepID=A0AAV5UGR6_9BILA|nr:hypothetical protein PENTCL1PPCAC_28313 [Pristionchus entomophagus]